MQETSKTAEEKELLIFERTFMWNLLQIFKQTLADVDDESNGLLHFLFLNFKFMAVLLSLRYMTVFNFFSFSLSCLIFQIFKKLELMAYIFWNVVCSYLLIWKLY